MSYQYGSVDLGIRNPFRFEGLIRAVTGAAITALGVFNLMSVKGLVAGNTKLAGWAALVIGLVLLFWGLSGLGRGLFQVFRFFVGRGAPTSLARNLAKSESHVREPAAAYNSRQIEQMLQGRKNLTFVEPDGWLGRLVHSLMPRLLFMPYPYRNMVLRLFKGLSQTFVGFLCFGLAWFSGTTGLVSIEGTPILQWFGLLLTLYLSAVWWTKRKPLKEKLQGRIETFGVTGLAAAIALAILLPVGLAYVHQNVFRLPDLSVSMTPHLVIITLMSFIAVAATMVMMIFRLAKARPVTEVSELRENWQESIHPQEIFIHFENIVMADRRYKEVPNRVYREFDANLIEEGSNDKGRFNGEMIQEVQPICHETETSPVLRLSKQAVTVAGFVLLLAAAYLFHQVNGNLMQVIHALNSAPGIGVGAWAGLSEHLFLCAVVFIFGSMLVNHAHIFWAEIQFDSLIVYFQCQGTYTESRLSTGASIYDSTKSENLVVRSSMTPWMIASHLVTSCFAASGAHNLEASRYILEMHKAERQLEGIVHDLQVFMGNREAIAGIKNEKDLASTSNIYSLNAQSRSEMAKAVGQKVQEVGFDPSRQDQSDPGDDSLDSGNEFAS